MSVGKEQRHTLTVDGDVFEVVVRPGEPETYDFTWLTGPHPGYGFSSRARQRASLSTSDLESAIRDFLAHVDRSTGYLE